MKKPYLVLMLAAALLIVGAGCGKKTTNANANASADVNLELFDENANADVTLDNANIGGTEDDGAANTNAATNANASANTNTATNTSVTTTNTSTVTEGDVAVTSPKENDELTSPFYVEGTAPSGPVYARVKSAGGTTIFTESISVNSGKFRGKLLFDFDRTSKGILEVFRKDTGGETDLVSIPVTFKLSAASTSTEPAANTNTTVDTTNTNTSTGY